ncbi:MAG: asparagine synthase (glutamine-hydrolysing) [Desulfobacteraceae bacterium Eth-SRB1]|nr:MAG: asparagine synthase (glutamine-hydrolysing) [Desulfobacteraceae bacterium Eth-SRB1]
MCGICGKLTTNGKRIEEELIQKMASVLSHRGPDDDGVYLSSKREAPQYDLPDLRGRQSSKVEVGLGHRRLSIIDLSEAGRQPMSNEDKTVWMVFNGEIYNFQSLKAELINKGHHFSSQTDCEVVIHLYEEEGIEGVNRLAGMFAFAIWDERVQTLFLCRDRLGIKPLVYCRAGDSLVFASEIKGILQDPNVPREIDWDALGLYLTFNSITAPYTIFKGVKKLRPGHILTFSPGKIEEKEYWNIDRDIRVGTGGEEDFTTLKNTLFEVMEDAVKMRMIADVPVGAFLSGGIDSSIIVGLMARNSSLPVKTYSIGYKDMPMFDETAYAREVAAFHKTDHHEFRLGAEDVIGAIPEVLESFDEPFADSSAIPAFVVSRETGRNVKVALSGDGGDELFAGYRMYTGEAWRSRYQKIPSFVRKKIMEPVLFSLPESRDQKLPEHIRRLKKFLRGAEKGSFEERFFAWNEIFSRDLRKSIFVGTAEVNHDLGKKILSERLNEIDADDINRMLYADVKESLPGDMLKKVDAMSMLNSLEVRVPFLDHRVCELAFSIGGRWKIKNGKGKYILLETFKDILPKSLHNRPKWGFEMPISKWLKSDLKYLIDEYLSRDLIVKQGIFDYNVIENMISNLISNHSDTSWQVWNLIVFQVWYSNYMEG